MIINKIYHQNVCTTCTKFFWIKDMMWINTLLGAADAADEGA